MDAAKLQARINSGYGHAARVIGYTFGVYRPASPFRTPIEAAAKVASLPAEFLVYGAGFNFEKQSSYKQPTYNGLFDPTLTKVGDYLFHPTQGTYFIAGLAAHVPPLCVGCNRTISITRAGSTKGFGAQAAYSGADPAKDQDVLVQWPASIIYDARGKSGENVMPMDLPSPFFNVLLPPTTGVDIRGGMVIIDDQTRRYLIGAAENSALGWRISAQQAVT
jgi:hypothetical protein